MTRQEKINRLIADDITTIMTSYEAMDAEYLTAILEDGFKGYGNYTDTELEMEYNDREFPENGE